MEWLLIALFLLVALLSMLAPMFGERIAQATCPHSQVRWWLPFDGKSGFSMGGEIYVCIACGREFTKAPKGAEVVVRR
jgi:hypothetical protein